MKKIKKAILLLISCVFFSLGYAAEDEASLKELIPQAISFEPVKRGDEVIYYKAKDRQGKFVGVGFKAIGKSYTSNIETMVGMLKDGTILAIKVVSQNETPGLGTKITEPNFTNQFRNIQNLDNVQAISGATVSSKVVIDSVKKRAAEIKALLKD